MKLINKIPSYAMGLLAGAGMLTSCSSELPGDGDSSHDGFRIVTRAGSTTTGGNDLSSTFGDPDPIHDTEKIQSWTVQFINESDKTVKQTITHKTASNANPVEEETFEVNVPDGTYSILGFANMTPPNDTDAPYSFSKDFLNNTLTVGTSPVPMTGKRTRVTITNNKITSAHEGDHLNTKNEIEVIRIPAKVEIKLKNTSSQARTVKSVTFGMLNKGDVPLFPTYSILGSDGSAGKAPTILDNGQDTPESVTINLNKSISTYTSAKDVESTVFYVRESLASSTHETGRFYVAVTFAGANGTETTQHFAPTDELQWINRNDHIVIPIEFDDLLVDWDVLFYPPIGGHPALSEELYGGSNIYKFQTQGKFVIHPMIRNFDGTPVNVSKITLTAGTTTGDIGIFKTTPTVNASGELTGELGNTKGTAILDAKLTFTTNGNTETRTRKIYIVRD